MLRQIDTRQVERGSVPSSRYVERWTELGRLGAPVSASAVTKSLMGATDTLIAASISPSAVAVVAIADLYSQLVGRVGGGIGSGAIALASQDAGAGAETNRDEAVTQAALMCVAVGVPAALVAVLAGEPLIRLVGGGELEPGGVRSGGAYLAAVLVVAPLSLPQTVFEQAFSAIGDTKTPFYVGAAGDVCNVVGSIALGFGVAGLPSLGVLGLGIATAVVSVATTVVSGALLYWRSPYGVGWSGDPTIAKQILQIGLPQSASGFVTSAAVFPFSRIVVGFGTEIYAGYQIAWRLYQLTVGTVTPGLGVSTKILVGQAVGRGDVTDARFTVRAALAATVVVAGTTGLGLAVGTEPLAALLVSEGSAGRWANGFAAVLGGVAVLGVANNVVSAALQGASETRVDLLSRIVGMFGGMVGVTWLAGVWLGWGVTGAYVGLVATYVLFLAVTSAGYLFTDWSGRAQRLLVERGSTSDS